MSELIDREAVREFIKSYRNSTDVAFDMEKRLDEIPAASPWRRVEEELPDDGDWAIFTNGKVFSVERFKEDAYNHFFPASQWFDFEDAIAWMPLPEPPKEDA